MAANGATLAFGVPRSVAFEATNTPQQRYGQLLVVSCYTRFDNLAHGPKGTQANRSLYTFHLDPTDGQLVLLSMTKDTVMNPAFSRFHPSRNVLYTCTESISEAGEIVSWKVCPNTGVLTKISSQSALGTSTCYLTMDWDCRHMLVVNYWDATVGVFPVEEGTAAIGPRRFVYDPNEGKPMKARPEKHVNHSQNDQDAQKERQSDPHSHAVVLDPFFGRIAYVPDLGTDLIRQFIYDPEAGTLVPAGEVKSGPDGRIALGPRYLEFHPTLPVCYVVNELSSEVSVFEFDQDAAQTMVETGTSAPTLRLIQTVRTIPAGFPSDMNTCGRICAHQAGHFVLVSNRGHDSIAVFRVHGEPGNEGLLSMACVQHSRGSTPRHFQFDGSGQWLITANQDSDNIEVFKFNLATGKMDWTGYEYRVPSPNFVCAIQPYPEGAESLSPDSPTSSFASPRRTAGRGGRLGRPM